MLNWFQMVFSSTEEQARLFTTLVSVLLAISILLLNQWFTKRKTRRDLLIEKLEKLASSLYSYQRISSSLCNSFFLQHDVDPEKLAELSVVSGEIEMLQKLYFPNEKFDLTIGADIVTLGYDNLSNEKLKTGGIFPADHPYLEFSEALHEFSLEVEKQLEALAKKYIT